jgi:hypothetical protein
MKTKTIDTIYLDKNVVLKEWLRFLDGGNETFIETTFNKFAKLLEERWIILEDDFLYDHNIKACWLGIMKNDNSFYKDYNTGTSINEIKNYFKEQYKINNLDLPTKTELIKSLTNLSNNAPFPINKYKRPEITRNAIYKKNNKSQGYDLDNDELRDKSYGKAIPLLRLTSDDNFKITNRETFFRFIVMGLVPTTLKDDKIYNSLINDYKYTIENFFVVKKVEISKKSISLPKSYLINKLLKEDTVRADLTPYNQKMLEDIEQGHWSLWDMENQKRDDSITVTLDKNLVARDPAMDINDGVVGIDFGTKSTVVVYQKDNVNIHPMRVGTGELNKSIASHHYENPTIMEFNDLNEFINDYNENDYRPYTYWEDLTISHTAHNSLLSSPSKDFNTFLDELKQWAGDKNRQLKIIDKKGETIDLPPFLQIEKQFNPIEIYAYYLGLNINNHYNGIYLNYLLSFPVTYEKAIREKILNSFEKGLKKSLPSQLDESYKEKLSVVAGASEPAAYAVVALEEYGFEPEDDERIFYGVFDFGGGTTDFDFGIYREANGKKERRYDYVIEHFGAGGDRYLGGENLLELMAFEIFKANKEKLLEKSIQFEKHPEKDVFAGSETLLNNSREAKLNTKTLVEELRGFWENHPEKEGYYDNGVLAINLTDIEGVQIANFELDVNKDDIYNILYKRIEKGVKSFFEQLRLSFSKQDYLDDIDKINIFLAGNSSKSTILKEIFNKELQEQEKIIKEQIESEEEVFKLFEPLASSDNNVEKPTGKTGVAFGLVKSRKSGKILVIDHNIGDDIDFNFYLGHEKKKKFRVDIDRKEEYNKWVEFIDASINQFEIFYTSNPLASTNKLSINDDSVKKIIIDLDITNENSNVYIRLVSPNEFEYVVAMEEGINNNEYLCDIKKISLDN